MKHTEVENQQIFFTCRPRADIFFLLQNRDFGLAKSFVSNRLFLAPEVHDEDAQTHTLDLVTLRHNTTDLGC